MTKGKVMMENWDPSVKHKSKTKTQRGKEGKGRRWELTQIKKILLIHF